VTRQFASDPDHWHGRAAEARQLANQMPEGQRKRIMLRIARDYDTLAEIAAERRTAQQLRQAIARYEGLSASASPELMDVYAAEIAACNGMLTRIEQRADATAASSREPSSKTEAPPAPTHPGTDQLQ